MNNTLLPGVNTCRPTNDGAWKGGRMTMMTKGDAGQALGPAQMGTVAPLKGVFGRLLYLFMA